ncbi:MAG: major facilitator superfamily transporter [Rhodobacteraceae bacterium]|nr:MAG: major facilitator superfamily transporter [Paracoccaceae bacterium]
MAVWLLALGQTLIYAGSYYAFPALLPDLEAATGWSKAELALGPTLAFLIMAALTPFTGRLVDRGLGGEMLIWLPALAMLGVAGLGQVGSLAGWLALWALIGVAQAGSLYETCFAFLTRRMGGGARAAITRVTLVAGFAGTLAFPLGHWLGGALGGQGALIAFAGLVALVVPINAVAVRQLRQRERAGQALPPTPPGTLQAALRKPAFWMIAASFMAVYLNHGILITYVLVLFADRGAEAGMAALAAAAIGPAQVVTGQCGPGGGSSVACRGCAAVDFRLRAGPGGGTWPDLDPATSADCRDTGTAGIWRDFGRRGGGTDPGLGCGTIGRGGPADAGRAGAGLCRLLDAGAVGDGADGAAFGPS